MIVQDSIYYSTVRIECTLSNGSRSTGTGFIYSIHFDPKKNTYRPIVITNKHVIRGAVKGRLLFVNETQDNVVDDEDHIEIIIENFESNWVFHPEENVDLCAMSLVPFVKNEIVNGKNPYFIPFNFDFLPTQMQIDNFHGIEEILMVGYPNGFWDKKNNKPLLRKGITATHISKDFNGRKEFLIDCACFPGSSGSPVFIYNEIGYLQDKKTKNFVMGKPRLILVGILYAGPQHFTKADLIIKNSRITSDSYAEIIIPNNLGYVIKSEKINDFIPFFIEK